MSMAARFSRRWPRPSASTTPITPASPRRFAVSATFSAPGYWRGFDVIVPAGTYFATADVGGDAVQFCRDLPVRHRVVAVPSSVFYDSGAGAHFVRFAFCKQVPILKEALRRLDVEAAG